MAMGPSINNVRTFSDFLPPPPSVFKSLGTKIAAKTETKLASKCGTPHQPRHCNPLLSHSTTPPWGFPLPVDVVYGSSINKACSQSISPYYVLVFLNMLEGEETE